jgi:DedD protein
VANAEGVREALASKGIASIIDNRVIDGRPLFRVRVGPYTSMNEANYWLSLIRSIDGFEDSQVRQTQSLR